LQSLLLAQAKCSWEYLNQQSGNEIFHHAYRTFCKEMLQCLHSPPQRGFFVNYLAMLPFWCTQAFFPFSSPTVPWMQEFPQNKTFSYCF